MAPCAASTTIAGRSNCRRAPRIGAWLDLDGDIHYAVAVGIVATCINRETIKLADQELLGTTLLITQIMMRFWRQDSLHQQHKRYRHHPILPLQQRGEGIKSLALPLPEGKVARR